MPTPYDPSEHHSRDPLYEEPPFNPARLTGEATMPTDTELLKALGSMPKRRGRPPGSKNKPRMDSETGQLSGGPRPRQSATPADTVRKAQEERIKQKRKRAEELEARIISEGNQALMQVFVSVGVPPSLLYIKPPEAKTLTPNFTALANRLAIQPTTAKVLALTLSEWEGSTVGAKIAATMLKDSPLRLAVLSIASVVLVGQQVKTVMEVRKEFEPLLQAYKKSQQEKAQQQKEAQAV